MKEEAEIYSNMGEASILSVCSDMLQQLVRLMPNAILAVLVEQSYKKLLRSTTIIGKRFLGYTIFENNHHVTMGESGKAKHKSRRYVLLSSSFFSKEERKAGRGIVVVHRKIKFSPFHC